MTSPGGCAAYCPNVANPDCINLANSWYISGCTGTPVSGTIVPSEFRGESLCTDSTDGKNPGQVGNPHGDPFATGNCVCWCRLTEVYDGGVWKSITDAPWVRNEIFGGVASACSASSVSCSAHCALRCGFSAQTNSGGFRNMLFTGLGIN